VSPGLIWLGGFAAILAGVVFVVDEVFNLTNPIPYLDVAFIFAMLLVLVAMVGFHALQQRSYGRVGRASMR